MAYIIILYHVKEDQLGVALLTLDQVTARENKRRLDTETTF